MTRDELLDVLFDELAGTGPAGRRALAEAEDHLADATDSALARGLDRTQAEADAVARFGSPQAVAAELRVVHHGLAVVWRPLFMGAWLVGILVALAAGVSGVVVEILGRAGSPELVAGDRNGITYTTQRCAEYLALAPHAGSCAKAAALDHWGELVLGRVGAGVLGLLALAALVIARRTVLRGAQWRTPMLTAGIAGTAMFLFAALVLGGPAILEAAVSSTNGTGTGLADGAVAALAAIAGAAWILHDISRGRRAGRTGSRGPAAW